MQNHSVWGKALPSMGRCSWCSNPRVVREFHATLAEVAAKKMLNEERIQQLHNAFLLPVSNQASQVSIDTAHVASVLHRLYCSALAAQLYFLGPRQS